MLSYFTQSQKFYLSKERFGKLLENIACSFSTWAKNKAKTPIIVLLNENKSQFLLFKGAIG